MAWSRASRRRVLLVTLGLLLLLDLGRSAYARVAYNHPTEIWPGDPYDTRLEIWPPALNVRADAPLGERVYVERCAVCHGTDGTGKGAAAPSMYPRPRDFTLGQFKYKTTPPGQPPSDADLINTVANGLQASAMPYFKDILAPEEIEAVVEYIKGFSPVFTGAQPEAIAIPPRVEPDEASLARGKALFTEQGCAGCHGADGRARNEYKDANGFTVYSRDLTAPWTFRGGSEPEQLWLRLTTGLAPSPMPAFADTMTADERWDVVNYVLSLARPAPWESGGTLEGPGTAADPVKRGAYIVHSEMCGLCHTQVNPTGIYRDDRYLAGGMQVSAYPQGIFISRNLTSDPETGLGNKSVEEIANIIRNGQASDRTVNFWAMPWMFLHSLSQEDALAIAAYLKTLPPVRNRIPPTLMYGFIETVVMKLRAGLPVASPTALTYAEGTYGQPNPGPLPADWPRRVLVGAQWLVLLGGVVAFVLAGPKERRFPRRLRSWIGVGFVGLGLVVCGLISWVLYALPATPVLPPEAVAEQVLSSIPPVDPAAFSNPEQVALAQRGRYLFSNISCAYCHTNDGSGGFKLSGEGMGTIWTRNISSHPTAGIGNWSDAEIARAIRSGIGKDGRPLHWQAMPWDHFSNLDEEDVRALVVYVRTLPPVDKQIPTYRPPSPDDCEIYTFWVVPDNFEPGCR